MRPDVNVDFTLVVTLDGTERTIPASAAPDAPFTIGRGADAKLFLNHATVSRAHARIVVKDGALVVEDLGSAGGTTRNGAKLAAPTRLEDGDRLGVGDVAIRVVTAVPEEVARRRAQALTTLRPGAVKPVKAPPDAKAAKERTAVAACGR